MDAVARTVGIGAVVFGNLAPQREKDIDFEIEKVTSLEGDSGPYLQYAHARCASIARKAGAAVTSAEGVDFARLGQEAEWTVAKRMFDLPDVAVRAAEACEPHLLCHYLLSLAGDFARWYTLGNGDKALRVIVDDAELSRARLALTAAVQAVLATGLGFLGVGAPTGCSGRAAAAAAAPHASSMPSWRRSSDQAGRARGGAAWRPWRSGCRAAGDLAVGAALEIMQHRHRSIRLGELLDRAAEIVERDLPHHVGSSAGAHAGS